MRRQLACRTTGRRAVCSTPVRADAASRATSVIWSRGLLVPVRRHRRRPTARCGTARRPTVVRRSAPGAAPRTRRPAPRPAGTAARSAAAACSASARRRPRVAVAASSPVPIDALQPPDRERVRGQARYASVLPPPVGKNSRCDDRVAGRLGARGSVSAGRFSSTNASWNGRQERPPSPLVRRSVRLR